MVFSRNLDIDKHLCRLSEGCFSLDHLTEAATGGVL